MFAEQHKPIGSGVTQWSPMLYVGGDGKLRGLAPVAATPSPMIGLAGKCVDVANGQATNGTKIQLYTCNGSAGQSWSRYPDGTLRALGRCLNLKSAGTANGTLTQLYDCHGHTNQQWEPYNGGLRNPVSGKCLDVTGANSANGTALQLYTCQSVSQQQWTVPAVTTPITSTGVVDDDAWHHVVLTAAVDHQELFLDGQLVGSITGKVLDHRDGDRAFVGNGKAAGWPSYPAAQGNGFPFTGTIDDVAFYKHPLGADQVTAHWAARNATSRLTSVTEPGSFTAVEVTYAGATGRVQTLTDRHGATWSLSEPILEPDERTVTISSTARDAISYTYDTQHNGRVTKRVDAFGTRTWSYNEAGFVSSTVDENGNATMFGTDARGNVTTRTTCRAVDDCQSEYFGYYLNAADPLDPRNDAQVWSADARSADANDGEYRTTRSLNTSGQVTQIVYPKPYGQVNHPTTTYAYTDGTTGGGQVTPYVQSTQPRSFIPADDTVLPLTGDSGYQQLALPFPVWFYGDSYTKAWVSVDGYLTFNHLSSTHGQSSTQPGDLEPNNAIYAFWDDLQLDTASSLRTATVGTTPNRQYVIEWRDVFITGQPTDRFNAEIVISENGEVALHHAGLDTDAERGDTAVVGIENTLGNDRLTYLEHEPTLVAGTAVVYTPNLTFAPTWATYTSTTDTRPFTLADQTVLALVGGDECASFALPFPIPVYGELYDEAWISTNGFIAFTDPESAYPDEMATPIPQTIRPNHAVYPFWDDLVVDASASVRMATTGIAPNRTLIVEWRDVYRYDEPGERFSVEVLFEESGEISFNYAGIGTDPGERGINAIVGIENETGLVGHEFSYREEVLASNAAIVYTPVASSASQPAPAGLLQTVTAANGGVTAYDYNAAGDLITFTDPVGLITSNTHDNLGRVSATHVSSTETGAPDYGTTTFTYNQLSQPDTVTAPVVRNEITEVEHAAKTTYTYDDAGRVKTQIIADVTGGDTRTTTYDYDPAGHLIKTTAPDNAETIQEWDSAGDLWRTTRPGGLVVEYAYDDAHRLLTATATGADVDPMNAGADSLLLEQRSYDPAGRLDATADAMGRVTSYTYYTDNLLDTVTRERDEDPDVVVEEHTYDAAGHPASLTTAGAVATEYLHDSAGNIAFETFDPAGLNRVTAYSYNADSTLDHVSVTGSASPNRTERVDYTYDLAGRTLTTSVDNTGSTPSAVTHTVQRDARGLVTRDIDPSGVHTDYTYDAMGRLVTTTGETRTVWADGISTAGVEPVTTLGRNTFGDVTHQQDPTGAITVVTFDEMGRPETTTLPAYTPPGGTPITATSTTQYDTQGLPENEIDPLGATTSYTYDKYGRVRTITEPDPDDTTGSKTAPVWEYAYNRVGELLDITDPTGAHTLATYDELGRQETATESERIGQSTVYYTTLFDHNDAGHRISATTALDHTTTATYDKAGQPLRITDPTGRFTEFDYDLAGRTVSTVLGKATTYASPVITTTYDLAGRAITTVECTATAQGACGTDLATTQTQYDGAGRPTQTLSAEDRPTTYGYDNAGQLTSITQRADPANPATAIAVSLGYDAAGRRTRMVDGNDNATTYTHTPWGLPESVIEPATTAHPNAVDRTWTTIYNAAALPVEQRLPGGVTRTSTYDQLGRLTQETGADAEATTTARGLDYDPLGRIIGATSPAGNHTYTWTDRGQLAAATGHGGGATYTYDAEGNLTDRTDSAGQVAFTYDTAGRVATIGDPLTATTATYGYNDAGQTATITYGTGNATRTYTYDDLGRVETDTWTRPDTTVAASTTYDYDDDGLLTNKTTTGVAGAGTNSYTYDGLGRLDTWTNPATEQTSYDYDGASNRTSVTTTAGTRTATYDNRNRLQTETGAGQPTETYTWTARGTLATQTGANTITYAFDAFERLTSVQKTGSYTVNYTYDSLDRQAQRNATNFGYADLTNNPTRAPTAAGEAKLLRDPTGNPLSSKTGTAAGTTLLADAIHADVTTAADPTTGALTGSTTYDPWGTPTAGTGLALGYQGGWTDPDTAQVNAHARWYQPTTGTFTSRDTWTLQPDPIAQANRYQYANASPASGIDQNGHNRSRAAADGGGSALIAPIVGASLALLIQ